MVAQKVKVIVAIDDPHRDRHVIDFITKYRWPKDSEIRLVHVIETSNIPTGACPEWGFDASLFIEDRKQRAMEQLQGTRESLIELLGSSCAISMDVAAGPIPEMILEMALESKCDLILCGSHGRGAVGRFFLGSVSLALLTAALCEVIVVKPVFETAPKNKSKTDRGAA